MIGIPLSLKVGLGEFPSHGTMTRTSINRLPIPIADPTASEPRPLVQGRGVSLGQARTCLVGSPPGLFTLAAARISGGSRESCAKPALLLERTGFEPPSPVDFANNRLIAPRSEHAMPDWIRRCALEELLQSDFSTLSEASLYRNLDQLHPRREPIETGARRTRTDPV
jgi:hypothetical protein